LKNPDLLKRYLLGDLPDEEKERLEERCKADETLNEDLRTAENDLIDAYVCQELSVPQRRQFETRFLNSPEGRVRIEVARMLMNPQVREKLTAGPDVEEKLLPAWRNALFSMRAGLSAAAIAGIAAIVFLLVQNHGLRKELNSSRSMQAALQNQVDTLERRNAQDHIAVQTQVAPPRAAADVIASMVLSPGLLRKGASHHGQVLTLSPETSTIVLMLAFDPSNATQTGDARYDVILETVEGRTIRRIKGLKGDQAPDGGMAVPARFSAQLLKDGDYIVTLVGRTDGNEQRELASYSFSIAR
jgi:hypothetical protein